MLILQYSIRNTGLVWILLGFTVYTHVRGSHSENLLCTPDHLGGGGEDAEVRESIIQEKQVQWCMCNSLAMYTYMYIHIQVHNIRVHGNYMVGVCTCMSQLHV